VKPPDEGLSTAGEILPILYAGAPEQTDAWIGSLRALDPALSFRVWPDWGDPDEIDFIIVSGSIPGDLSIFRRAKAIQSTWAGVNALLRGKFPAGVPIARMVDRGLSANMVEYLVFYTLDALRDGRLLRAAQRDGEWLKLPLRWARELPVGILGLGTLGRDTAVKLRRLGFPVSGWSRTPKAVDGVVTYAGSDQLAAMLPKCDVVVCLLPLTPQTTGILSTPLLDRMKRGAALVHLGRGAQMVTKDVVAALDAGQLGHAYLDVFETEPLPADDPLWGRADVSITPHIAALTEPRTALEVVAGNVERVRRGQPPLHVVSFQAGY